MKWLKRLALAVSFLTFLLVFVLLPIGGSFLITNSNFKAREPGPNRPQDAGLSVEDVEFETADGKALRGWWNPGESGRPVIIFLHGLNRSRIEMLERAAEAERRGYGVLLFDFRNHGASDRGYTTLGIHESRDVCAASAHIRETAGPRSQLLWGISLGASTGLLAAESCGGFSGIVAESAFLSLRDTIAHHFRLYFHLPAFPIANMIEAVTEWRLGLNLNDGDVEAAVRRLPDVPICFIAGGKDRRMPPEVARRLFDAAKSPLKRFLLIPEARHGEAFRIDRVRYLENVFSFFDTIHGSH